MTTTTMISPRAVQSIDPNSGEVWGEYSPTSPAGVLEAVAAARGARERWSALPLRDRCRALVRFRDALYRRRHEVAAILERETGKPRPEGLLEILGVADAAVHAARHAPRALRTERFRSRNIAALRKTIELRREPWGVVGIIAPWNYPLLLAACPMITSLVAGNAVVLKPSEFTPATGLLLGELFHEAGFDPALVAVLPGDGSTGAALVESGVDRVVFTGSAATGRKVAEACGRLLIPIELELGGSDPAIVLEDADREMTAEGITWARFSNAGQTCTAAKRVIAVGTAADWLVPELSKRVAELRSAGEERDLGAVIRPAQRELLESLREDAIGAGARVAFTGERPRVEGGISPTILTEVPLGARAMREETFGPILPVVRVDSVDEAIRLANSSEFGLSASVWTANVNEGLRIARALETGTAMVNDAVVVAGLAEVPHGGMKASGIGRMHGIEGIREATRVKAIVTDSFTRWRQAWWFPYTPALRSGLDHYLTFAHGTGAWRRIVSGVKAVRLLYLKGRDEG